MPAKKRLPAWFKQLGLREGLLCWLSSAQSRFETAAIAAFRDRFRVKEIRAALRELHNEKAIQLDEFDRVRWSIQNRGRNWAAQARDRAKKQLHQKAAA